MLKKLDFKEKYGIAQLGAVFAAFFLILQLVFGRDDNLFNYISLSFLVAVIFFIRILFPLNKLWLGFGEFMGKIVGSLLLGLVFFLFLTPIALIRKFAGGKEMNISFDDLSQSFWIERKSKEREAKEFERQF